MDDNVPKMELLRVLMSDARRLVDARERCLTIHHTADIRSAGDEVEVTTRKLIRGKVPSSYHVGHGHIVDASLASSPQIDVVVSDNTAPVLFTTENGSEYFPYESVHAIGEVKSTYESGKKYVEGFVKTIRQVKGTLKRAQTPQNYIGNGVSLGGGMSSSEPRPYRNPIFSFMLFVNGENFDPTQIADLYKTTDVAELPNVICILDRGVVVNAQMLIQPDQPGKAALGPMNLAPEFHSQSPDGDSRWCFLPLGDEEARSASDLGFLWFFLIGHLNGSILMRPDMLVYLHKLFVYGLGTCLT
jgi:hypothetical protein